MQLVRPLSLVLFIASLALGVLEWYFSFLLGYSAILYITYPFITQALGLYVFSRNSQFRVVIFHSVATAALFVAGIVFMADVLMNAKLGSAFAPKILFLGYMGILFVTGCIHYYFRSRRDS